MIFRFILIIAILALILVSSLPDCVLVCNPPEAGAKTATELAAHSWPPLRASILKRKE